MENSVLESVLGVFSAIGEWFSEFVPTLFTLFWTPGAAGEPGSLTFLGVLAVSGLAFSVVFLIIGLIQNFLHFRG